MLRWIRKQTEVGEGEVLTHHSFDTNKDSLMLNGALQTAWFFMNRASEFCASSGRADMDSIIRGADIQFMTDGRIATEGEEPNQVVLQLKKTKADQAAFGTSRMHCRSEDEKLCVVRALWQFKLCAPERFGVGREALLPLFRWADGRVLTRIEVQNVLQKVATAVGLPGNRFMSHSLRIGGASALYQTNSIEAVKRMGRWQSSAVRRYLFESEKNAEGMAAKMANADARVHYT